MEDNDKKPYTLYEICRVCFWQYDEVAHDDLNKKSGANGITLNEAIQNYKQYGVCKKEFIDMVRPPLEEELPENNGV